MNNGHENNGDYIIEFKAVDRLLRFGNDTMTVEFSKRLGSDTFQVFVYEFKDDGSCKIQNRAYDPTVNPGAASCLTDNCDFNPAGCAAFIPVVLGYAIEQPPEKTESPFQEYIATMPTDFLKPFPVPDIQGIVYLPGVPVGEWVNPDGEIPNINDNLLFYCPICQEKAGVDFCYFVNWLTHDATLCVSCFHVFRMIYHDEV